jgi:DNA-binding NarL/FixJ family response regulator
MEDEKKFHFILLIFSGIFFVLVGLDLISDYSNGSTGSHLVFEGLLLSLSVALFFLAINKLFMAKKEIKSLQSNIEFLNKEKEKWKNETNQLLEGLSVKIEDQFLKWKLTKAETEVGFLLLKGFSLKEIADIRNTKLKTVQQQSQSIYQKTRLASRSELAAFFLEDLLPSQKKN